MSWFKLNDGLNTLKGQILTNVSNVVHDVFTDAILDDSNQPRADDDADADAATSVEPSAAGNTSTLANVSDIEMMEAANRKIEELSSACANQDIEVV